MWEVNVKKCETLSKKKKITKAKRVGDMAEVIEHLSSKCGVLSSNPSTSDIRHQQPPQVHDFSNKENP
jgi:hypothetical protein